MPRSTLASMPFVMALALMAGCGGAPWAPTERPADPQRAPAAARREPAAALRALAAGTGGGGGAPAEPAARRVARPISAHDHVVAPLTCNYVDAVHCNLACTSDYQCISGRIVFLGSSDGCFQVTCSPDAGTDAAGQRRRHRRTVCTLGADQTCNDNPIWSSIHGRCTDAGVCLCNDAGTQPGQRALPVARTRRPAHGIGPSSHGGGVRRACRWSTKVFTLGERWRVLGYTT